MNQEKAKQRAAVILRVRAGEITASQGAEILGISRKTYYEWEKKGLQGMMDQLRDQSPGRPQQTVDPQKAAMEKENASLKARMAELEQVAEIRAVMRKVDALRTAKKNHC